MYMHAYDRSLISQKVWSGKSSREVQATQVYIRSVKLQVEHVFQALIIIKIYRAFVLASMSSCLQKV